MQNENVITEAVPFITSPLEGEDARRAGEGVPHIISPSFVLRTFSPSRGEINRSVITSGFTLIELLVVVLIIGILSAVAVPQYQKAVEKSRLSEGEIVLRALRDAQEFCLLENGGDIENCKGETLFENIGIELGEKADSKILRCEGCARKGTNFVYTMDESYIYAERVHNGELLYDLETTAIKLPLSHENAPWYKQILCGSRAMSCDKLGYSEQVKGSFYRKP